MSLLRSKAVAASRVLPIHIGPTAKHSFGAIEKHFTHLRLANPFTCNLI